MIAPANRTNGLLAPLPAVRVSKPSDLQPLAVSLEVAAKLCGISPPHFRKFVLPHLPAVTIGERRVFRITAIQEWLAAQETIGD